MQLLIPKFLLSLDGHTQILENHAVLIQGDQIAKIGPVDALLQQYPQATPYALPDQLLMPGLINMHTHAAMNLLRGLADDLPLHEWLQNRIWPLEGAHADQEFVHDGTVLAAAEMLLGGTTTFNDMYFFPEESIKAALGLGARIVTGMTVLEFPTRYANDARQYIDKGLQARNDFLGETTVHWTLAPHAPYTVSDETFTEILKLSDQLNLPIHCHVHETASEVSDGISRHGHRPFERLRQLGLINERFISVHSVHLNDTELAQLAQANASLVHCPSSNLKLASGIAPIAQALKHGVNVVVGTDGAASNNKLDLWEEARLGSLLCKGTSLDATAWPAGNLLLSLTNGAAHALGLQHQIGRIKQGWKADLISVALGGLPHRVPTHNVISELAFNGASRNVEHVWVAGKQVVESQQLVGPAAELVGETIRKVTRMWQTRLQ